MYHAVITCKAASVDGPIRIQNLGANGYGDQIYYKCPHGYLLDGPKSKTCIKSSGTSGKWDPALMTTCERM